MPETIYEYATKSWPIANGCSPNMSCAPRCWAKRTVRRLAESPNAKVRAAHEGLTVYDLKPGALSGTIEWTGITRLNEAHLTDPLKWRKPRRIAVAYHGDLFRLPMEDIDRVFAMMAICPQHTFLVLTKAARELREYVASKRGHFIHEYQQRPTKSVSCLLPFENVWLGVSVTNQADADERIPLLLQTPAAVRWISLEPMVGPVDLRNVNLAVTCIPHLIEWHKKRGTPLTDEQISHYPPHGWLDSLTGANVGGDSFPGIDWVVLGGESGPNARPMHPDWARSIRDQCRAAGVPFFFKQWGEWAPYRAAGIYEGAHRADFTDGVCVLRVGKKAAGNLLDGCLHNQMPEVRR